MNGGWFWWCPAKYKGGGWTPRKDFVALWRHMHRHFTEVRGLDNLLWVYSPNAQLDDDVLPTDHYYPGGDVVDVVGYDIYTNDLNRSTLDAHGSYTRLAALGKPFGITEFGPLDRDGGFDNRTLLNGLKQHRPEAVFCLYWSSWTEKPGGIPKLRRQAIIHQQHAVELLTDPWSITREDLAQP
jgi:mannan endo-1,4-beta-mannosidase